ncbi:MAG: DUF6502 family protein [Halioglobus sp.]
MMETKVEQSLNQALSAAALKLLRPLVRVLLRHGMAYGSFAEIVRKAYVEEGLDYMSASGKRVTIASVSALTGLTRKESKRLAELERLDDEASSQRYNRAIRVVGAWATDKRYLATSGEPAILSIEEGEISFSSLVKEFSGDIPPYAMLSVLQSNGTIEVSDGDVRLLQKAYVPATSSIDKTGILGILGTDGAELIDTIGHNMEAVPQDRYFQRKVSNVLIHPDAVPAFREMSNKQSQLLLEEYHRWLLKNELDLDDDPDAESYYVAVGIYYTQQLNVGKDPS